MRYLYKINESAPTPYLLTLIDCCQDMIRRGEATIKVIFRCQDHGDGIGIFSDYCVVQLNARGGIETKFND